MEQTFILIKPDGYKRRLVGTIISRFEQKGFTLTSMKLMKACDKIVDQHYIEHVSQPWYENFKSFFKSGNVIAMVWSGKN
ncbi:nucleoside diphosphate kinase Ndk1, partial [Conglomerata obtusa]